MQTTHRLAYGLDGASFYVGECAGGAQNMVK